MSASAGGTQLKPIQFLGDRLRLLDQTRLPFEEAYIDASDDKDVALAIREMRVRGAPAIGVAAAYGVALGARGLDSSNRAAFTQGLEIICQRVRTARPTAVNLSWAVERLWQRAQAIATFALIKESLVEEARRIEEENERANRLLSQHGSALFRDGQRVLTYCNTGARATGSSYGTALGVIRAASVQGKKLHILVGETRPLLQGARLTTWELGRLGIACTLVTDAAIGHFLKQGKVDAVIVGADRIAANGDTANKIGTYTLAVLARAHTIPFYVVAPISTIDPAARSGEAIPIEERNPEEVRAIAGLSIVSSEVEVANPAFDVTPHELITAIITERGILCGPAFEDGIARSMNQAGLGT